MSACPSITPLIINDADCHTAASETLKSPAAHNAACLCMVVFHNNTIVRACELQTSSPSCCVRSRACACAATAASLSALIVMPTAVMGATSCAADADQSDFRRPSYRPPAPRQVILALMLA